jgi:hypothetical protein
MDKTPLRRLRTDYMTLYKNYNVFRYSLGIKFRI